MDCSGCGAQSAPQTFLPLVLLRELILPTFGFYMDIGTRRSSRRSVICASLFGVGAPEALVIGVVALLVFGPKGLAEVNYMSTSLASLGLFAL